MTFIINIYGPFYLVITLILQIVYPNYKLFTNSLTHQFRVKDNKCRTQCRMFALKQRLYYIKIHAWTPYILARLKINSPH